MPFVVVKNHVNQFNHVNPGSDIFSLCNSHPDKPVRYDQNHLIIMCRAALRAPTTGKGITLFLRGFGDSFGSGKMRTQKNIYILLFLLVIHLKTEQPRKCGAVPGKF